jgi:hypothetical protein
MDFGKTGGQVKQLPAENKRDAIQILSPECTAITRPP